MANWNWLFALILLGIWNPFTGFAQQQEVDYEYLPVIEHPLFEAGKGPLILVDNGHHNFHTLEGKFAPFGQIAELNGFQVKSISTHPLSQQALKSAKILVIANALHAKNVDHWSRPIFPAFTAAEIEVIRDWVAHGGHLFLIADHMPFAGAVANLALAFGFTLFDGFAYCKPNQKFDIFSLENGMLEQHALNKDIDSIVSFTGHAFRIPEDAISIITLDSSYKLLMPETAWEFSRDMEMLPAGGLSQLAYSNYGSGKIIMAGKAAMFTAQKAGAVRFGLNAAFAPNNLTLLLHLLKWLSE